MIIANKYEIPDTCPDNCRFYHDAAKYGQNVLCTRCPVFNCRTYEDGFCLLRPEDFRPDWAEEWYKFFKGEIEKPELYLCVEEE